MTSAPKLNNSRQLANDLRRTHFTLGTAEPRYKSSEYVQEYTKKGAAVQQNQGDNLNLRASHFQLGNQHAPSKTFCTINQKDYKQHIGFQPPCLNEDKKRDLRSSHFTLGNYNPQYASLSHSDFPEKYIPYGIHKQEQEEQRNKMRKHNHDFTETTKKQFSSEYNNHFNKQTDPSMLKQGLSAQELKQKVVDLRKSHVVLGEDYNAMQSIAQKDYQFKAGTMVAPANDNVAIRKTNFQLGVQPNEFASVYQQYYVPHNANKSELNKELIQDLRASHFTLGQEENMYATNTGASYKGPPKGYKPVETLNPNLQKNHFTISGDNPTTNANKTTYSNYHRNFGNAAQTQARDQTMDRASNWKLGGQKSNWVSETQSNFKPFEDAKPADLEGSLKADLRSSHFKFNDVNPKSQFKSLQQTSYVPKTGVPNKLDEELKKDLQANHFKLGHQVTPYQTSSGSTYQSHNGKPSSLDPSLAKDLRANHFTYGNGQWPQLAATEYRSNYFWKEENQQAA